MTLHSITFLSLETSAALLNNKSWEIWSPFWKFLKEHNYFPGTFPFKTYISILSLKLQTHIETFRMNSLWRLIPCMQPLKINFQQ